MKKITLEYPASDGGAKIDSLTMRRPKVRDLLAAERQGGTDADREMRLFSNLCEVSPDCISDMDMSDYLRLQEVYKGFLPSTQQGSGRSAS